MPNILTIDSIINNNNNAPLTRTAPSAESRLTRNIKKTNNLRKFAKFAYTTTNRKVNVTDRTTDYRYQGIAKDPSKGIAKDYAYFRPRKVSQIIHPMDPKRLEAFDKEGMVKKYPYQGLNIQAEKRRMLEN